MNSKAMKIAPLFFILLMTLSALTYTPTAAFSNATATPRISVSHNPAIAYWTNNSLATATYNGHWSEYHNDYYTGTSQKDLIITAQLHVLPNGAKTYSNISVDVAEFFTGQNAGMEGLWYNISTNTGTVVDMKNPTSGLLGNYSFFFLKSIQNLKMGNHVYITSPFDNQKSLNFQVNMTETVLGIQTTQVVITAHITGVNYVRDTVIALWISNNTQGLLMRMTGYDKEDYTGFYYYHRHFEMSMEIGQTNILDLVPLTIPEGMVPWMSVGKYLQYNLQGSGTIDASLINHTKPSTWQLPGDSKFRATISGQILLRVERGTTAYVDPYHSSRYVWVLHLMFGNTSLLLPDLRRAVYYLNQTIQAPVPLEAVDYVINILSPFNHTGLVRDTWFLVDNASGRMYWPGIHFESIADISPISPESLGSLLAEGLGLQVLSSFAQSYMYQDWTIGGSVGPIHNVYPEYSGTRTEDMSISGSVTCVGTEYLAFPGGGGGHCWRLESSLNVAISQNTILNRSLGPPEASFMSLIMDNSTNTVTGSGHADIERTSGFPLEFVQHVELSSQSNARWLPYFWYSTNIGLTLDLSLTVPATNIWFTNVPVYLTLGLGGGNMTSPESTFGEHGFDVWMNGANNVVVTSSASQPPDSAAPPGGQLPFVYLDIKGVPAGSGNIILYVFYNRTRVQALNINEDSLKLYTFNASSHRWEALQSTHLTLNATHGVIFAVLPHLSYFAVLGSAPAGGGIPTLYIIVAAVAVIAVLAAVVYIKKGKGKGDLK